MTVTAALSRVGPHGGKSATNRGQLLLPDEARKARESPRWQHRSPQSHQHTHGTAIEPVCLVEEERGTCQQPPALEVQDVPAGDLGWCSGDS